MPGGPKLVGTRQTIGVSFSDDHGGTTQVINPIPVSSRASDREQTQLPFVRSIVGAQIIQHKHGIGTGQPFGFGHGLSIREKVLPTRTRRDYPQSNTSHEQHGRASQMVMAPRSNRDEAETPLRVRLPLLPLE